MAAWLRRTVVRLQMCRPRPPRGWLWPAVRLRGGLRSWILRIWLLRALGRWACAGSSRWLLTVEDVARSCLVVRPGSGSGGQCGSPGRKLRLGILAGAGNGDAPGCRALLEDVVEVSGGAVREGVVLGCAPSESLPGSYRPTASASADVVSPPWRRRRGVHPLHILGSSSSGESLRPIPGRATASALSLPSLGPRLEEHLDPVCAFLGLDARGIAVGSCPSGNVDVARLLVWQC